MLCATMATSACRTSAMTTQSIKICAPPKVSSTHSNVCFRWRWAEGCGLQSFAPAGSVCLQALAGVGSRRAQTCLFEHRPANQHNVWVSGSGGCFGCRQNLLRVGLPGRFFVPIDVRGGRRQSKLFPGSICLRPDRLQALRKCVGFARLRWFRREGMIRHIGHMATCSTAALRKVICKLPGWRCCFGWPQP